MARNDREVVFVSQRFPPDKGGNAARIHDIATNLGEEWNVTVLSPPPSYPPGAFDRSWQRKRTDTVGGVTVHRLWSWQPRAENPGMARRLAYYLVFGIHAFVWLLWHARSYDVVVTTTPPISTGAPGLVAAALGKPWIVDVRDLWIDASISLGYLEAGSRIERLSRRFQRYVLHTADRIAITTDSLGDSLQETYGESLGSKLLLVPNGVDVDRFEPGTSAEAVAEPASTADGGRQTIIYTGNLGTSQDLESCVRAMEYLETEQAVLRLVGSGDVESKLRELVATLGVGDRVRFAGLVPREEVPALLAGATVGIAPLKDTEELAYAMPTKLYEYMASGLPTVVTGRGEIERFADRSGGCVHAENDPERIAARLDGLLGDEQSRRRLAANGRQHVEERYDRKEIARSFGEELTALVEGDRDAQ